MSFQELIRKKWYEEKFVCVGLDPVVEKIPHHIQKDAIFLFNKAIIDATHDLVCAYKPNSAFYEAEGIEGLQALRRTVYYIKDTYPNIPVILDAKRGDIGNTNDGYVKYAFEFLQADAITIHGYLGQRAMQPFLDRSDKGIFVLARTSNPGAEEFQDLLVDSKQFYKIMSEHVLGLWSKNNNVGIVMGATNPDEILAIRMLFPDSMLLIPGIGAQGGDVEVTVRNARKNFILNSSRGIIYASEKKDFADKAREEVIRLEKEIANYL